MAELVSVQNILTYLTLISVSIGVFYPCERNELIKIRNQRWLPLYEERLHPTGTLHSELKV